ncbi:retinoic acid receptor alpha-B [Tachysurus ichikawai]
MYENVDVVGLTPNPFLSVDYYHQHQQQHQQQKRGCLIQDKGMPRSFVPWSSSHCREQMSRTCLVQMRKLVGSVQGSGDGVCPYQIPTNSLLRCQ